MKKVTKIISFITTTLLVLFALLFIIPIVPIPGNYQVRTVLSGSMEPTIKIGSVVFVRPSESYKVGDIITYIGGNFRGSKGEIVPVTHRIVEIKSGEFETEFVTKGDANDSPDITVTRKANILGKVFFKVPYIGYAVETARKPYGFFALILIPAALIIFDQAKNILDEIKKMRAKNAHLPKEENMKS